MASSPWQCPAPWDGLRSAPERWKQKGNHSLEPWYWHVCICIMYALWYNYIYIDKHTCINKDAYIHHISTYRTHMLQYVYMYVIIDAIMIRCTYNIMYSGLKRPGRKSIIKLFMVNQSKINWKKLLACDRNFAGLHCTYFKIVCEHEYKTAPLRTYLPLPDTPSGQILNIPGV